MFHLPPSEGHCQFHPNSINEFSKCFIVSLFQKRGQAPLRHIFYWMLIAVGTGA